MWRKPLKKRLKGEKRKMETKIEIGLKIASQYGDSFAFDGCHKIYIIKNKQEKEEAEKNGYKILNMAKLKETYLKSCPLRLVNSWDLKMSFVPQY
jgi:hypothetical protein